MSSERIHGASLDRRPAGRVAVGLAAVIAMLLLASAFAGVVAADGAAVSTADNGDLAVTTDAAGNGSNISVTVGQKAFDSVSPDDGGTYRISAEKFPGGDLSNVTVVVNATSDGKQLAQERLDLRHAELDGPAGFTAADASAAVRVPLSRPVGLVDGAELDVAVGGETVTATVRNDSGTTVLDVPRDGYRASLGSEQVRLASPGGGAPLRGETTVNLLALAREATVVERTGSGVRVTGPAIRNGTTYGVRIETTSPVGAYRRPVAASESGRVAVDAENLWAVRNLTASVVTGDGVVVARGTPRSRIVAGTVGTDGTSVSLDDADIPAGNVSHIWIRSSDGVNLGQSLDAENGTLDLSETGYRLVGDSRYRLLVVFADRQTLPVAVGDRNASYGPLAAAQSGGGGGSGGNGEGSAGLGGLLSAVDSNRCLIGVLVFLVVLVAAVVVWFLTRDPDRSDGAAASSPPTEVTVTVRDGKRDERYGSTVTVIAEPRRREAVRSHQPAKRKTEPVTDGTATLSLDGDVDDWDVTLEADGRYGPKRVSTAYRSEDLTFRIPPYRSTVVVRDDASDEPLSNVDIEVREEGGTERIRTGRDGTATLEVSRQAGEARVAVDRDRYESKFARLGREDLVDAHDEQFGLGLVPERGSVAVTVSVDGAPRPNVAVELEPREEWAGARLGEAWRTTDANGCASFGDVPVGTYRVVASADQPWFECAPTEVSVSADETVDSALDVAFVWTPDDSQSARAEAIRGRVDDLTSSRTTDVAVPRYYGTVVDALLDTIERLPACGRQFARTGASPERVSEAVLDRADDLVGAVDDAMTTKQNVDLFTACADMPDASVEWGGSFDVDRLFDLIGEQRVEQRRELRSKLQSVDGAVDRERGSVASIYPVSDTYDGAKRLVGRAKDADDTAHAVTVFAVCGLLDAAERLLGEAVLRERLERTMF